jgi:hypothetical protein
MIRRLGFVCLAVLWAGAGWTQTVTNPTAVEFTKSPDHDVMLDDQYTPAITEYTLDICVEGTTTPVWTYSLGKPDPNDAGVITVNFSSPLMGWPVVVNTPYFAYVTARGPYGSGRSNPSNLFTFNNQYKCSFSVVPMSWTVVPGGGTLAIKISVSASGCQWTLTLPPWLTATPTLTGTATATVTLTAAPNNTGAARTVTLNIGSMRPAMLVITQEPLPVGAEPPRPPGIPTMFIP